MPTAYPRVLLVNSASFGRHTATAITLSNLFDGWPADRLALVHSDIVEPARDVCSRTWRLSPADVPVDRAIRRLLGARKEQIIGSAAPGMPGGLGAEGGARRVPLRLLVHGTANAWSSLLPYRPSPAFWSWVAEFRPQVIYSMLGSSRLIALVTQASIRCGVPVVPHFMDDWPTTYFCGALKAVPRAVMHARLRAVLRRCQVGMSIGPAMAAEYERRYRLPFRPFMNCVDVPEVLGAPEASPGRPVRLLFFGGLHLNRWRAFEAMGEALQTLHGEGHAAELVLYASKAEIDQYGKGLKAIPHVHLHEMVPFDALKAAIAASDILVHVDSFDPGPRRYLRLSMSTKIPLCMASGKPLLAYGPPEMASCRYIQDCRCGVVVGNEDPGSLMEALRSLVSDPMRREELGRQAWVVALRNHRAGVTREGFRSVLAEVAGS